MLLSRVAADIDKEGVMPQRRAVPDNGPPDADPQVSLSPQPRLCTGRAYIQIACALSAGRGSMGAFG